MKDNIPEKLYKYMTFGINALKMLTNNEVYFQNPSFFNDPLDCKPDIKIDVDIKTLEKNCLEIVKLSSTAKEAEYQISNQKYLSTEHSDPINANNAYIYGLSSIIKDSIYKDMESTGVYCLSEKWNCPLMWSHYSENHKGLCVEFETFKDSQFQPTPVNYNGPHGLSVMDVFEWKINNSVSAKDRIIATYFFTKAPQWQYEAEWRLIKEGQGVASSGFPISSIYFGLRCDWAVIISVVKLFSGTHRNIKFYKIAKEKNSFQLIKHSLDIDNIEACGVRESATLIFGEYIKQN